jgi:VWFA-related protein
MRWAVYLAMATLGFGQETTPEDAGVVIRSTTSLVQVRVVAKDAKGRPVADLRREDFQVQDDRKPQPITLFTADRGALPASSATIPSTGESAETPQEAGSYSLILLDWLNTLYADRLRAKDQVIRLFKSFQPSRRVAIYLLGNEPRLLHDFTSDMAELVQVVEETELEWGDLDNDTPGRFDARFGSRTGPRPGLEEQLFFMNKRVTESFRALELISDRLVHVPGRKSLIWMSDAFPLVVDNNVIPGAHPLELVYYQNLERLLARLNRADIAVYGVDAHGLATTAGSYPGTMVQFAERTGGTAFYGRNDLDTGVRLALEDMRVSYILGFHVPPGAAPGIHEIRVRVSRSGVTLRYRESYELAER